MIERLGDFSDFILMLELGLENEHVTGRMSENLGDGLEQTSDKHFRVENSDQFYSQLLPDKNEDSESINDLVDSNTVTYGKLNFLLIGQGSAT